MRADVNHIATWWEALLHPKTAAGLVLDTTKRPGFDRFLVAGTFMLYAFYGLSMGLFRGFVPGLVSGLKMPFLYLLTLLVSFPLFYALNCLKGPQLELKHCIRLLLIAVSANAVAIASYAPMSYFFTLTTSRKGYHFLVAMHIVVLGLAGLASAVVIALVFRATAAALKKKLRPMFILTWVAIYALIGTQMSWVLRPWIGTWGKPYTPFRKLGGSFIEHVLKLMF